MFSQTVNLPSFGMGGSIPSRPTMSFKFEANSVPEGSIIEQRDKTYHDFGDSVDHPSSIVYQRINDSFVAIEQLIDNEWTVDGLCGGGEWINCDEAVFEIINHGVRTDW